MFVLRVVLQKDQTRSTDLPTVAFISMFLGCTENNCSNKPTEFELIQCNATQRHTTPLNTPRQIDVQNA